MSLAIIDYGSGNLRSVAKAFERVANGKHKIQVTSDPKIVGAASHIVLPGVGAFADCMQGLKALPDMLDTLQETVITKRRWFLGVCVGMQMLFDEGLEHGTHKGLGWLKGKVVPLKPADASFKIPHMGWNELTLKGTHVITKGLKNGAHAYFVHSYHAACDNAEDVLATTNYGQTITAIVGKQNIMGTQFHPEKSQETGLKLLENFIAL